MTDRPSYICDICEGHNEPYRLWKTVWEAAGFAKRDRVCVLCVEKRLERKLTLADFNHSPLNLPLFLGAMYADPTNSDIADVVVKIRSYARNVYKRHRNAIRNRTKEWGFPYDTPATVIPFTGGK